MTGASQYAANLFGRWITGQHELPAAVPTVWMALFTTLPDDTDAGGVEVAGNGYARVQVAGQLVTTADAIQTPVLTFGNVPAWVLPSMSVADLTNPEAFLMTGEVLSTTANTVTLAANPDGSILQGDTLTFSVFGDPSGEDPLNFINNVAIACGTATGAGWGTVIGFALFDDPTAGDLLAADYLAGGPVVVPGGQVVTFSAGSITIGVV
jgi:hypothetical protein